METSKPRKSSVITIQAQALMAYSSPNSGTSDYPGEQREVSIMRRWQCNRGHTLSFSRSQLVCTLALILDWTFIYTECCHCSCWCTTYCSSVSDVRCWNYVVECYLEVLYEIRNQQSVTSVKRRQCRLLQRNYYFSPTTFVCLTLRTDFVYWHQLKAMAFIVRTVSCCSSVILK